MADQPPGLRCLAPQPEGGLVRVPWGKSPREEAQLASTKFRDKGVPRLASAHRPEESTWGIHIVLIKHRGPQHTQKHIQRRHPKSTIKQLPCYSFSGSINLYTNRGNTSDLQRYGMSPFFILGKLKEGGRYFEQSYPYITLMAQCMPSSF